MLLRTRPHRSGTHVASKGSEYSADVVDELDPAGALLAKFPDERCLVIDGLVVSVGNNCARASRTSARAAMKPAYDAAMLWLEVSTCSSSSFNSGSLKVSHHLPRISVSLGSATFQLSISFIFSGVTSLYAAGVCAVGV